MDAITLVLALGLAATGAVCAQGPVMSVPPAANRATPDTARVAAAPFIVDPRAARITLALPSASERAAGQVGRAGVGKPAKVGYGRTVPANLRTLRLAALDWQPAAGGGRTAQLQVTSTDALGLRVALQSTAVLAGATVRVQGSGAIAPKGPFTFATIADSTRRYGEWWSPIVTGDTATFELSVPAGVGLGDATVTVDRVSHLYRDRLAFAPGTVDPGAAGACELNWRCEPSSAALTNATRAVGLMSYTSDDAGSFTCTGTLLNDTAASNTPWLFTAHHCMDSAYAAQTLTVVWFYDANSCASPTDTGTYTETEAGAVYLAASKAEDWALVRLKDPAPAGANFAAWNAAGVTAGAMIDLHHPRADLKKFSAGAIVTGPAAGYVNYTERDVAGNVIVSAPLMQVVWSRGVTEGGSSGSALLTLNASGYYEVRGGLYGGDSSCTAPKAADYFSRIDRMLPLTRDYLAPGTAAANQAVVVEYYNKALDHFFMTAAPAEVAALDSGAVSGWQRTGLRFLAYTEAVAGANPVCRYYRTPGAGDSHFYSASPVECGLLRDHPEQFPGWTRESDAVFYIALPDPATGACGTGTHPLWRFYHSAAINHRYTPDLALKLNLAQKADAWIAEGYGPDAVIMCAPDGA